MGQAKPIEGEPVAERRTTSRSAQGQVDLSAYEAALRAEERVEGHEKVCSERYRNIESNITDLKGDIKELSRDAKVAIDDLARKQEGYHRTNSEALAQIVARSAGERGLANVLLRNLPTVFTAGTFAYLIWGPK